MTNAPPNVKVARTLEWMEPSETLLKLMTPVEKIMLNNQRVVMNELEGVKNMIEKVILQKTSGSRRGSLAGSIEPRGAEAEASDPEEGDFFEELSADLTGPYAKYITDNKFTPRQQRIANMRPVDKELKGFFDTFLQDRLGADNEVIMAIKDATTGQKRNTYLKLGQAYVAKNKAKDKGKAGSTTKTGGKRGRPRKDANTGEGVVHSSQGSDRQTRSRAHAQASQASQDG